MYCSFTFAQSRCVGSMVIFNSRGRCQGCGQHLGSGQLSCSEHATLKNYLASILWQFVSSLPNKQVTCFTSIGNYVDHFVSRATQPLPQSLKHFIAVTGPYDIVLDALNIGYKPNHRPMFCTDKVSSVCVVVVVLTHVLVNTVLSLGGSVSAAIRSLFNSNRFPMCSSSIVLALGLLFCLAYCLANQHYKFSQGLLQYPHWAFNHNHLGPWQQVKKDNEAKIRQDLWKITSFTRVLFLPLNLERNKKKPGQEQIEMRLEDSIPQIDILCNSNNWNTMRS